MIHLIRTLCVVALLVGGALSAAAQPVSSSVDFDQWASVVERADTAIQSDGVSDKALSTLRAELVDWRTKLGAAQSVNAARIATVQAQVDALGPAPTDGQTESENAAAQRRDLTDQLNDLTEPRRRAEIAHTKATGLIAEIDALLRERQARAFFEVGPSPLSPANWSEAVGELTRDIRVIGQELSASWANPSDRVLARENRPLILLLLAMSAALILRGRAWMERLALSIYRNAGRGRGVGGFVVSLGQVVAPVLGLVALHEAAKLTGFFGPRGSVFISVLPWFGAILFGARWLGAKVFPRTERIRAMFDLDADMRREGRMLSGILGGILALDLLLITLVTIGGQAEQILPILRFPIFLALGVAMYRLGRLVLRASASGEAPSSDEDPQSFRSQLAVVLGRIVIAVAVIVPVLALFGYGRAANDIGIPSVLTLALMALLATLMILVREVFDLIAGENDQPTGAMPLTPLLLSYALVIASLPLLALIWGARVADLVDLWARFRDGFTLGDTRLTPGDGVTALIVFFLLLGLTRLVQGALRVSVLPRTNIALGGRTAITSGVGYVGIFLSIVVGIMAAGIDLSNLALVAGALSVGIGFGLQNIVSNFVSGIILLIERPISKGDMIQVGTQTGFVRDISVRSTRIATFDRTDVIVPNADLISGTVTNLTRGNLLGRAILPVGVAYGTDTRRVEAILSDIAAGHEMIIQHPPPAVLFMGFGASSLDFEIRAIVRDVNMVFVVRSDINHAIAERFASEGIEIPFPQQDVWLRNSQSPEGTTTSQNSKTAGAKTSDLGLQSEDSPGSSGQPDADMA